MSNNKQSSVEWLMGKLIEHQIIKVGQTTYGGKVNYKHEILFEQAKLMHKEERISDYYQGACDESDNHGAQYIVREDAERWYNETFGGEQ